MTPGPWAISSPTAQDRTLVAEAQNATGDIAKRQLEDLLRTANLGLDESLSARGVQGSSIESAQRAGVARDASRQIADLIDRQRQESASALINLPFQRAGVQISANQALLQQLGLGNVVANQGLQERLSQLTTTNTQTESGISSGELVQLAGVAAKAARGGK